MANNPPISLTTVSGGINRLRTKAGADKNSLYDLVNGYVTQSNTVKVRPGTFRKTNIATYSGAGATKGLLAYQGDFHVFSSSRVSVPPGYQLHVLTYPLTWELSAPSNDWSATALILTMNGANSGTTFTDTGPIGNTVTAHGATTSTTEQIVGSGSGYFNGSGYLTVPFSAGGQLDLENGSPFTVECYAYLPALPTGVNLMMLFSDGFDQGGTNQNISAYIGAGTGGNSTLYLEIKCESSSTPHVLSWTINLTAGAWHYFTFEYASGSGANAWLDGVSLGVYSSSYTFASNPNSTLYIGATHSSAAGLEDYLTGYVQLFRITRDLRYTFGVNFTPPTVTSLQPSAPIKEIHFAAPYLGGIYVVAEFDVSSAIEAEYGSVFHYWIQSSVSGSNSNEWEANTDYQINDVVIPTTPNGLTYIASRRYPANPVWQANTLEAVGNVVEPTVANGFMYTCTAVLGNNPSTGATEPTWPTTDGATVNENSEAANDETVTLATAADDTVTPSTPPGYRYDGGIFI